MRICISTFYHLQQRGCLLLFHSSAIPALVPTLSAVPQMPSAVVQIFITPMQSPQYVVRSPSALMWTHYFSSVECTNGPPYLSVTLPLLLHAYRIMPKLLLEYHVQTRDWLLFRVCVCLHATSLWHANKVQCCPHDFWCHAPLL